MELRVTSVEYTDVPGITPVPSKGNLPAPSTRPRSPSCSTPSTRAIPGIPRRRPPSVSLHLARLSRHHRGSHPHPLQPSTSTLRVVTRMVVELVDAGPGGANVSGAQPDLVDDQHLLRRNLPGTLPQLRDAAREVHHGSESGKMLVICYDAFAASMQPFVTGRTRSACRPPWSSPAPSAPPRRSSRATSPTSTTSRATRSWLSSC